jgi:ribosomal protein S4
MSSYKKSLLEYKKLKYFYFTLRDYQFRKFALKGLPLYTRFKAHFLSFLEFRLLTLCVRLGFYDTHIRGRQEINHFGIFVDNKRVYYSNYVVKVGSTFLLKPFVGFNNFKIGLDSFRKPRFTRVRKMLKSWIPRKILSLRARVRQFTWRTRHKQSYNYSVSPIRKSVVRSNKIDSTVRILGGGISNKFAFSLYQNWFKIFEFSVFSIKKRRRSRQYRRPFFKNRDDFLWRQEKKKKNPLIYENRYEDRLIDRRIVNVKNFLVPRKLFFERSVYPIFFRNSPFFSSTFRRKNVIQWRRKVFHLRPKPYMLISWALKKIYLIGAPRLQDVTFPFLADPTLAFGFINSR